MASCELYVCMALNMLSSFSFEVKAKETMLICFRLFSSCQLYPSVTLRAFLLDTATHEIRTSNHFVGFGRLHEENSCVKSGHATPFRSCSGMPRCQVSGCRGSLLRPQEVLLKCLLNTQLLPLINYASSI